MPIIRQLPTSTRKKRKASSKEACNTKGPLCRSEAEGSGRALTSWLNFVLQCEVW